MELRDSNSLRDESHAKLRREFCQMAWKGLKLAEFDSHRQKSICRATNLERFKPWHGSLPVVCAQTWEDLQLTNAPEAEVNAAKVELFLLLRSLLRPSLLNSLGRRCSV
jgi:hypothetical protein